MTAAAERLLGWDLAATCGDPHAATPSEAREEVERMHARIASGEMRRLTAPVLTVDGTERLAEWRVTRRRGRIYTFLVRFIDRPFWLRKRPLQSAMK